MDLLTLSLVVRPHQKSISRIEHSRWCTGFSVIWWHSFPWSAAPHTYFDHPTVIHFWWFLCYSLLLVSLLLCFTVTWPATTISRPTYVIGVRVGCKGNFRSPNPRQSYTRPMQEMGGSMGRCYRNFPRTLILDGQVCRWRRAHTFLRARMGVLLLLNLAFASALPKPDLI